MNSVTSSNWSSGARPGDQSTNGSPRLPIIRNPTDCMTLSVFWIILINHPDEPFAKIATLLGWRDRGDPVVTFILAVLDLAKVLSTPPWAQESWQLRRGATSVPALVTMSRTWIEGGLPFQLRDPDFGRSAVYGGFSRVKGTTAVRTERALHGTGKGAKLCIQLLSVKNQKRNSCISCSHC